VLGRALAPEKPAGAVAYMDGVYAARRALYGEGGALATDARSR
jgi:hypothetical protein